MKKFIKLLLVLLSGCAFWWNRPSQIFAAETSDSFSVGTVFSEHQTDKSDSFYDIRWTPGATDTFGLRITNSADHEKTFTIKMGKARTNAAGSINYTDSLPETEAQKYKLADLVTIAHEVVVPAGSSQTVNGTVAFPNENYHGILIGGLNVAEEKAPEKKSSTVIRNVISYTIPLVLRGDSDTRPAAEIRFDGLEVKQLAAESYSVNTKVYSVQPTLLTGAKFKATIVNADGKTIDSQESQIDITPETKFDYPVELKGNYPAGEYKAIVEVTHDTRHWNYQKKFMIDAVQAKKIDALKPQENFFQKYLVVLLWAGILMIVLIVSWLFRRKRKKME
ncbi:MAG: DUF916 and DUF3324 domain-containing protein [Enterococcaceae bacterium]|jgi:hypothetical protein|nr:DUF916 and DUF3324 domain-containing protein [Enterococcaceae bacterium]MCI1919873.1 DUF916 and DUF3324 domain-containing protein [Enterococcaceae bacterium]